MSKEIIEEIKEFLVEKGYSGDELETKAEEMEDKFFDMLDNLLEEEEDFVPVR